MLTVIYRWRLQPGKEEQFVDGWTRVTTAIHASCGSYGSRLHRCSDGTWLAYAMWPSAAARDDCHHPDDEGRRLMDDAVSEHSEPILAEIVLDLLQDQRS